MAQNGQQNGGQHSPHDEKPKRVLIVGAGAAGMSAAYHLTQQPGQFDVTLIDAVDYCGGQAFSIPLDKERHGASWCNQGVQGGSYIFHHTATMFARQGYRADPVDLQVSFGKDEQFWTNVFPTQLLARHQKEIGRLVTYLRVMRWFEVLFALLPLRLVFKLGGFSDEFTNTIALPMTALFLGTGNATPDVPAIMFERLCTSPTYGMWYEPDRHTVVSNRPPMIVFPKLSDFYSTWKDDLVSRGVTVRFRQAESAHPALDHHNPAGGDPDEPAGEEMYDELILCCLADTAKKVLGKTASWRERKVLGSAKFSDDITITHNDADYMKRHYENFYREDLAMAKTTTSTTSHSNGSNNDSNDMEDYQSRLDWAADNFRPMYYIKIQFPEKVPFEQHVFQTIYLNKARDSHLWSDNEIDEDKIIRKDWWHQLCHSYTHYLLVVSWVMFLQAKRRVRFAGSWTLVNAHEVAIMSGLAAADLEHDRFAFLCFRLYYLLAYGKWYRRRYTSSKNMKKNTSSAKKADGDNGLSQNAKDGQSWATGLYGSVYKGPGVSETARSVWKEDMKKGFSTDNLAEKNAPGRSQP
ncbi:FAD/NAD(P)-binding domain-containing protein [Apiospora phragmitis]|uniref:FAD/NAD(P)-binding domain-containing protein n=1 Tax=Apiospora phragmitis TaxID=2905665 RepID=A0ABR1VEE2_9PEZI